jgi:hypothetical protein
MASKDYEYPKGMWNDLEQEFGAKVVHFDL